MIVCFVCDCLRDVALLMCCRVMCCVFSVLVFCLVCLCVWVVNDCVMLYGLVCVCCCLRLCVVIVDY